MKNAFGLRISETVEELIDNNVALLVWDMQHAIADRIFNRDSVVQGIQRLIESAHRSSVPVIFSQHYSNPFAVEDAAWIRLWWKRSGLVSPSELMPLALPGSSQWEILTEVTPSEIDLVIPKTRPSLFIGTSARELLAARGITTLLITGATTERGVLTTANHAQFVGIVPVVVSDAVGSYTEAAHDNGLQALSEVAEMTTVEEVLGIWAKGKKGLGG